MKEKTKPTKAQRVALFKALRKKGMSGTEIGQAFGVSENAANQWLRAGVPFGFFEKALEIAGNPKLKPSPGPAKKASFKQVTAESIGLHQSGHVYIITSDASFALKAMGLL